jgi:hypothetical protein
VVATITDADGNLFDPGFFVALRAQLATIGISIRILRIPQTDIEDVAKLRTMIAGADMMVVERNASQAVDPVVYLRSLPYLRPADRTRLQRIDALPHGRREAAAAALGADLERDAVYVGNAYYTVSEFVSKRLGCIVHHPAYPGLDIAALCLR